ncbi:MAG: SDR family oxidoreductase [Dehalococcoidales bacterium]|nr:SDR family oxidoreductase [Dehalococcoidales bacterium]
MEKLELKGKNILVTGGAGFIGSNLVDALSPDNNVTVLDNLSSGQLANLEKSRARIKFVQGDVKDAKLVEDVVAGVEYVFHLAANVGNIKSIEDPIYDMEINVKGTINVLEACVKAKIKRLVYSASGAIFGEARYLPIDEDHPVNPESPYAVSKLAAEKYCFAFHKVHGLPVTAVRYFNVYGPRQGTSGYANVIAVFFGRIKNGKPLTIYGDGKQTRDFVFVKDVARANMLAAASPSSVGHIFNIATGKETNVNELVEMINQVSGKKNEVVYAEPRAGEVRQSRANITKAQKVLGYNPTIELRAGVRLTWEAEMGQG